MDTKVCTNCGLDLELVHFTKRPERPNGYRSWCKTRTNKRRMEHKLNKPDQAAEARRRYHRKHKYGVTAKAFDAMKLLQSNLCAMCGQPEKVWTELTVDHCHETGAVRSLLCRRCNALLGQAGDDIDLLRQAISYLEGFHI